MLRSALTYPCEGAIKAPHGSNSGAYKTTHIEPGIQIMNAGMTKAHKTVRTNDQAVSNEAVDSPTAAKQPRLNA